MALSNLQSLIGKWVSDPAESGGQKATIYFGRDGRLVYLIHGLTQAEVVRLIFRVERNELITQQPSAPREERTAFEFTSDGRLLLNLGGIKSHYSKVAG